MQLWPSTSYRRLLQVSLLRAQGVTSHRSQRIHLWLLGNAVDLRFIRADLAEAFGHLIRHTRASIGIDSWTPLSANTYPSARRTVRLAEALARRFPAEAGQTLVPWEPAGQLLPVEEALQRVGVTDLLRGWLHHLLTPASGVFRQMLEQAISRLPEAWRAVIPDGVVELIIAGVGLLADPDRPSQPLLDSLAACSDQGLLNLRDAVSGWNELWRGGFVLMRDLMAQEAAAGPRDDGLPANLLVSVLNYLGEFTPIPTSEHAVALLAWLLLFRERGVFDGARLGFFARQHGGTRLFGWIATHLEELQAAAGAPPGSLVGVPDVLPSEQRSLWALAYPA